MLIILGVCGKLMAGIACLSKELGMHVIGYDKTFEPPMLDILRSIQIELHQGYPNEIKLEGNETIVVGNQMKRTDPIIQFLIQKRIKLYSAPEWLLEFVLRDRQVIAVTGCHGKTTITSMVAWVLKSLGLKPGYLIGGVHQQLGGCAALGEGEYFVIEADEYDSAFFDKRPKFIHYWPRYVIISGIEYEHADIYPSIESIILQYQYLLRLLPKNGHVISCDLPNALMDQINAFGLGHSRYGASKKNTDLSLDILPDIALKAPGSFNQLNAISVVLLCRQLGLNDQDVWSVLSKYHTADRRQTIKFNQGVIAYDDFAHHPTAVQLMLRSMKGQGRVHAIYHPATFTQRCGKLDEEAALALSNADFSYVILPNKHQIDIKIYKRSEILSTEINDILAVLEGNIQPGDQVVVMSAYYLKEMWDKLLELLLEKANI